MAAHTSLESRQNVTRAMFERYRTIVPDWQAFCATLREPLPFCIWIHPNRVAQVQALIRWLEESDVRLHPISWLPGAYRWEGPVPPGKHLAFLLGLYHIQEAVSQLPVYLLDPRPGERILDLCAAPGNKTAQIALHMEQQGTLVANDRDPYRVRILRRTLDRLGITNVTTLHRDGANLPGRIAYFDRVLVDAPCSCEGTSRKHVLHTRQQGVHFSEKLSGLQRALLRKAVHLCRPGGRIVYATCTYAPEENEEVVDAILREYGSSVLRIRSVELPEGLRTAPGLTAWRGRQFHPSLQDTLRIWPHLNDTGGFYVAVLEKIDLPPHAPPYLPSPEQPDAFEEAWPFLEHAAERFGLPQKVFRRLHWRPPTAKTLFGVAPGHAWVHPELEGITGLGLMRVKLRYPKLTTAAALLWGPQARRHTVELTTEQVAAFLRQETVTVSVEQLETCDTLGYVLCRQRGWGGGIGFWNGRDRRIQSLFPRSWLGRLYEQSGSIE